MILKEKKGEGSKKPCVRAAKDDTKPQLQDPMHNEDLLIEILLWLPAKYLVRLKLVCKKWLSIITSRCFSHRHILFHRHHIRHFEMNRSSLLWYNQSVYYLNIQNNRRPHGQKLVPCHFLSSLVEPTIQGSSNGLFLIQFDPANHPLGDTYVYNPTTEESRKITLNANDKYTKVLGLNLAFDPLKSPHYKIICVRGIAPEILDDRYYGCQIEIYDSNTCVWKVGEGEEFVLASHIFLGKGIYWNGDIHWHRVFYDFQENRLRNHPQVVYSIDATTRMVQYQYVESNDRLHYVAHFTEKESVMVFELKRDYSEWSTKYHVNLNIISGPFFVMSMIMLGEDDALLIHQRCKKIVTYRIRDESIEEVVDFRQEAVCNEQPRRYSPRLSTFQYMNTLASP